MFYSLDNIISSLQLYQQQKFFFQIKTNYIQKLIYLNIQNKKCQKINQIPFVQLNRSITNHLNIIQKKIQKKVLLKNIEIMQIKLPSSQQIYDYSTEQLTKLKQYLSNNILNKISHKQNKTVLSDELESLKQLLQTIELEIQQRKTIQYFTELCINDGTANKYVKEITDFNNQFKKLANQLLNNQNGNQQQHRNLNINQNNQKEYSSSTKYYENQSNKTHITHQSEKSQFERGLSQASIDNQNVNKQNQTIGTQTSQFTRSTTTQLSKKAGQTTTKKMGLGHGSMKKNTKNSMQQFIKATLAKSKPIQYVSTKGGMIKKSPQKIANNQSHVSRSQNQITNTPLSTTKSIKSPQQQINRNDSKRSSSKNTSQTVGSHKSINQSNDRQNLMKKRNQAIQKLKNMKKPFQSNNGGNNHNNNIPPHPNKKKNPKGMDSKSLVEMVKQQQQAKKKRQSQPQVSQPKNQATVISNDIKKQQQNQKVSQSIAQTKKPQNTIASINNNRQLKQTSKKEQNSSNMNMKSQSQKSATSTLPAFIKKQLSNNSQKQNQFPIKQEINPICSQSDTQSDNQSSKKISSNKNSVTKNQAKLKAEEYCPIPEEEIEESIVFSNAKKDNIIKGLLPKNQKQQNKTNIETSDKFQKQKSQRNLKQQIKTQKQSQNNLNSKQQIFGKITQQVYNPNGYENYSESGQDITKQNILNDEKQCSQYQEQKRQIHSSPIQQENTKIIKKINEDSHSGSSKNIKKKQDPNKKFKKNRLVDDQFIQLPATQQLQSTKMYNQEYWLHIKEQAQAKIQRFKQEKQLQRKQRQLKDKILQQQSKKIKGQINKKLVKKGNIEQQSKQFSTKRQQISQQIQAKIIDLNDDDNDKFIEQQKQNLKKILSQNNVNGSTKKASKKPLTTALIKQPKASYPKPQFNYLQIYPTFNHIFNVSFTKPQNQALLDIPCVMKQIIQMFQIHIDYKKNRVNNFRPAIFLPFDNRNSKMNQFNDARLLLQHAQTTYVNLKTLIERLEVFNANIQGQFENCSQQEREKTQFYRVVKTKQQVYDIITTSFLRRKGWKQLPHGQNLKANWNLFWSWSKPQLDMSKLLTFQRINHYPFNKNLSRKDLLYKNIDSFRKTHKVSFPFLPLTFNLPKQFTQFSKRFHQQQLINRDKNYWIMKPIGKSRGRGIKLINSLSDLNYLDNIVVQKYIANPLLIEGYKFDMRIYVLVTSFHPLEAFVYRQGFARLSTEKYSLEPGDMKNNFVHLTNFAINRHNVQSDQHFQGGSKISIKSLKQKINKMNMSFASIWSQVHEIIIKSLLACSVTVPPFPAAFELFGYDIMIDQNAQCHLIQINASPSLQRSYLIDQIIKQSLIDDIIEIVNPPSFSKQELIKVFNERLAPDFRNKKGVQNKQAQIEEEDLIHLARIMRYQKIRKYGQMPQKIGLFQMVAPSPMSKQLQKLIKSKSGINAPHNID